MSNTKKVAVELKKEVREKLLSLSTVSEQIRFLSKQGLTTGDISRTLTKELKKYIRYQWVNNVLSEDRRKAAAGQG